MCPNPKHQSEANKKQACVCSRRCVRYVSVSVDVWMYNWGWEMSGGRKWRVVPGQWNNLHDSPSECLTSKFSIPCFLISWSTNRYFPCQTVPLYLPRCNPPPPLIDSSHASSCPLHTVIVSLFSSCWTGSVTFTGSYVTLWDPREQEAGSMSNPTKAPTILYGPHIQ